MNKKCRDVEVQSKCLLSDLPLSHLSVCLHLICHCDYVYSTTLARDFMIDSSDPLPIPASSLPGHRCSQVGFFSVGGLRIVILFVCFNPRDLTLFPLRVLRRTFVLSWHAPASRCLQEGPRPSQITKSCNENNLSSMIP